MKFIMATVSLLRCLFLSCFLLPLSLSWPCPESFHCGHLREIHFPFTNGNVPECGLLPIIGCGDPEDAPKLVQFQLGTNKWFKIESIDYKDRKIEIRIQDDEFQELLDQQSCSAFNYKLPIPPASSMLSFYVEQNITLFKCSYSEHEQYSFYKACDDYDIIYSGPIWPNNDFFNACTRVQMPVKTPFKLTAEILIEVEVSGPCLDCHNRGEQCRTDGKCIHYDPLPPAHAREDQRRNRMLIVIGAAIGSASVIAIGLLIFLLSNKRRYNSSGLQNQSRNIESDNFSNTNPVSGNVLGVPVFSYEELEEATNNFDRSKILGSGGFGIVYYGKLKDGREVAVKHLFERNYRRVEQFKNEIEILTRLRHGNLVSLYGCTSRHSRELLLVYEYIPNGTLGCHLHGNLAKPGSLPWPVRMRIAIETARALSYLHACDIIHRDVKTSNLLLDNHFCVKVADFGLSRLFPNFVTHVSTAPAGSPGYLDPEYHQCYQLTNKSDVYSFGVVLIELISSMPAIDITRSTDKIKLANLAVKKIQKSAFIELVDPSLGFESDNEVKRMIVSVAKLAFQCLQRDKELRPSMDEVLQVLQKIEIGKDGLEHLEFNGAGISDRGMHVSLPTSLYGDEVGSLKNLKPQRLHQTQ